MDVVKPRKTLASVGGGGNPKEDSPIMIAVDSTVAVIGIICLVITLLALGTNVFEPGLEDLDYDMLNSGGEAGSANSGRGNSNSNKSSAAANPPLTPARIHALLDGTVGRASLVKALRARNKRKAFETERNAKVGAARLRQNGFFNAFDADALLQKAIGQGPYMPAIGEETDSRSMQDMLQEERDVFQDDASFFVSLGQYRDVLCPQSVAEIFGHARNPRRVFIGIIDQRFNQTEDVGDMVGYPINIRTPTDYSGKGKDATCAPWYMMAKCRTEDFCPTDNVRVRHSWPHASKGPTWGRYYGMLLYQGESYFLMIDSHSRFVHHWDAQSILNLLLVPKTSKKPVMSHYPGAFQSSEEMLTQRFELAAMVMCHGKYTDLGIIRMQSIAFAFLGFPKVQPYSAGGYVFGDAQFVHEVPFDPYLYYVFDGEEVLYSVRLWTHGFDLYTPKNNILFHHYARHNAPRFWEYQNPQIAKERDLGQARVRYFMRSLKNQTHERIITDEWAKAHNVDIEEDIYGLGRERTLAEYHEFAGIDPVGWNVSFDFCHNISLYRKAPSKYHPRGWEVSKP